MIATVVQRRSIQSFAAATALAWLWGGVEAAPPDTRLWREAVDVKAECETDTTNGVTFTWAADLPAGTRLTGDNMYPDNYTTGDMVVSCKLTSQDTNALLGEFSRLPMAYNKKTKAFEFNFNELLIQISGLPIMQTTKVYRKAPQAVAPTAAKSKSGGANSSAPGSPISRPRQ
jgi:hypothetical protein